MNVTETKQFETHLTLAASHSECIASARVWANESGLKWTEIELSQGNHPLQPMITFWGSESLKAQHAQANQIEQRLKSLGVRVVRVKTEIGVSSSLFAEPGQYFESHVKLHLESPRDWSALRHVTGSSNKAHISRNARRVRDDGSEERFLTLRSYDCDGTAAATNEHRLLDSVRENGLTVLEVESEFVLFDSNLSLDDGWEISNE